jgi:hypothetical protein
MDSEVSSLSTSLDDTTRKIKVRIRRLAQNRTMLSVFDCVADCIRFAVAQATEWQRIGNQIDAAMILCAFAGYFFGLADRL